MKPKTLLLVFVTTLLVLTWSSCKSKRPQVTTTTQTTIKDSTSRKLVPYDTTIIVKPADTLGLSVLLEKLTETPIVKKQGTTTATIRRVGNQIEVQCIEDELRETIAMQREIIEFFLTKETQTQQNTTVTEKETPEWAKPLIWIGAIWLGLQALKIFAPKLGL